MLALQFLAIDPVEKTEDEIVIVSSSSDSRVRRWRISLSSAAQVENSVASDADVHETSVYALLFDNDDGDLWTASADGTAKCLSRSRNWAIEESIEHGDYVRAVALTSDWVVTAGRSEDVKVWERATGELFHTYEGHFEEVTGLVATNDEKKVVSVSIDGTVRVWPLDKKNLEKANLEKAEKAGGVIKEVAPKPKVNVMSAEEEAELAELMDDSD